MNFNNFYFNNSGITAKEKSSIVVDIDESEYDRIVDGLNSDYRIVIESESYKDEYGYGYKYLLRDGESLVCLTRYKDEIDNQEAKLFCSSEELSNEIRQKFTNI